MPKNYSYTPSDIVFLHAEKFLPNKISGYWKAKFTKYIWGVLFIVIGIGAFVFFVKNCVLEHASFIHFTGQDGTSVPEWFAGLLVGFLFFGGFLMAGGLILADKNLANYSDTKIQPGTKVAISQTELLYTAMKAAIYAHVAAGDIEIYYAENNEVGVIPTDVDFNWPRHSLEDRLNFLLPDSLRAIFSNFQSFMSQNPSAMMLRRMEAGQIVRGLYQMEEEKSFNKARLDTAAEVQAVQTLLALNKEKDPDLDMLIDESLSNAFSDLTYFRKDPRDNSFQETNIWNAEVSSRQYATSKTDDLQQWVVTVFGAVLFVILLLFLASFGRETATCILFIFLVGLAVGFSTVLRILPFGWSRKRREKYLASLYDAEIKKKTENSMQTYMKSPVQLIFVMFIAGIFLCVPLFIYIADHEVIAVLIGLALYGMVLSSYLRNRSRNRKARNSALLAEALKDIDAMSAGSVVNLSEENAEAKKTALSFSVHVYHGKELPELPAAKMEEMQKRTIAIQEGIDKPLHLMALRVFGSGHMENFITLIKDWQRLGSMLRLSGPDTVDDKSHTIAELEQKVVKDLAELKTAVAAFNFKKDGKGYFPINAMQCSNAIWKEAIHLILQQAAIVVMDLSALSPKNKGIAYELRKVIDEVPLQHVLFIIDHSTDRDVLHALLEEICSSLSAHSPNINKDGLKIQLLNTGGGAVREPAETMYEWQKRVSIRIDGDHLVKHLYASLIA